MNRYAKRSNFGHPVRTPLLREHFVYRAFDAEGTLLYVGCSRNWRKRLGEHSRSNWYPLMAKVRLEGPYNYETAREIEYNAIESERSLSNYSTERREIAKLRSRIVDAYVDHLVRGGMDFFEAVSEATDVIDELIPVNNTTLLRIDDLTVPTYRRIASDFIGSLSGAA